MAPESSSDHVKTKAVSCELHENPLCALLAKSNRACAACLQVEQSAVDAARNGAATVRCSAGLCHTAIPVKLGTSTIGFLMSGQVALEPRTAAGFETLSRLLSEWGLEAQMKQLEAAYYRSTVLPPAVYAGQIGLLEIFSRQLSILGSYMGRKSEFATMLKLVAAGRLKPVVDRTFPLAECRLAHEYLEAGEQFGKVVLAVD